MLVCHWAIYVHMSTILKHLWKVLINQSQISICSFLLERGRIKIYTNGSGLMTKMVAISIFGDTI